MKTPREILLEKHRSIEPKLDALREEFVAGSTGLPTVSARSERADSLEKDSVTWRDLILAARWHLAGLTAMWVLIAVLRTEGARAEAPAMARHVAASPRTLISALKENRLQIMEYGGFPAVPVPPVLQGVPQSRRSYLQANCACA